MSSSELQTRIERGDLQFLDGLVLLGTIASQRWFGGKSRDVLDARVLDAGVAPDRFGLRPAVQRRRCRIPRQDPEVLVRLDQGVTHRPQQPRLAGD